MAAVSYNGKGILNSTGSILQVIQTVKTDTWASANPSAGGTTWYPITGFTATITPSSVSNKILVQGNLHLTTEFWEVQGKLTRNNLDIPAALGDARGIRSQCTFASAVDRADSLDESWYNVTFQYLDSPASISAQTYGISVNPFATNGLGLNIQILTDPDNADWYGLPISTLTLMEISA